MKTIQLILFLSLTTAHSAETRIKLEDLAPQIHPQIRPQGSKPLEISLPTVEVKDDATFQTLANDPILPTRKIKTDAMRPGLLQNLKQALPYNFRDLGFPTGAANVNLGGRTTEDTQFSTLGVPLGLPQGGGADLSTFPQYLWESANIQFAPSQAGFSQQAASGSIQLLPWTRAQLQQPNLPSTSKSRVTTSYNRQVATFSIGSRYQDTAVLAGSSFGLLTGPSASFSQRITEDADKKIFFHMIGADVEGPSRGDRTFETPLAVKRIYRILPVLETAFRFADDFKYEATAYADFQRLINSDPGTSGTNSDTRTFQYGLENAISYQDWRLGLAGRYVRFTGTVISKQEEYPLRGTLTRTLHLTDHTVGEAMVGVDELQEAGRGVLGKIGVRQEINAAHAWFTSLQTLPKMPTLSARYWVSTFYNGNAGLKPEQVTFLQSGHEYNTDYRAGWLRGTHTIRAEKRSQVQLIKEDYSRDENAGSASLVSLQSDHGIKISRNFHFNQNLIWTYSVLEKNQRGYPSLARFNDRLNLNYQPTDALQFDFYTQMVSDSTSAGNARHPGYVLHDVVITHTLTSLKSVFGVSELALTAGLENIFDVRAEPVFLYPLPGRMVQAGLSAKF